MRLPVGVFRQAGERGAVAAVRDPDRDGGVTSGVAFRAAHVERREARRDGRAQIRVTLHAALAR